MALTVAGSLKNIKSRYRYLAQMAEETGHGAWISESLLASRADSYGSKTADG
jgi:hypothetical protein